MKVRKFNTEEDNEIGCNITAWFNTEDETYGELRYDHILTGSPCESPRQILQGWCEKENDLNNKWDKLVRRLENADTLMEWLEGNEDGDEGTFIIYDNGKMARLK